MSKEDAGKLLKSAKSIKHLLAHENLSDKGREAVQDIVEGMVELVEDYQFVARAYKKWGPQHGRIPQIARYNK